MASPQILPILGGLSVGALGVGALIYGYIKYKENKLPSINVNDGLPSNIDEYFKIGLKAAFEAGNIINKYINDTKTKTSGLQLKKNHADLVTEMDKKCEDIIISYIKKYFPNDDIIAEESYSASNNNDTYNINDNKITWFIDPIDGTTNFYYGMPTVCVLIGLRYKGKAIMGIIHCPILNETYYGIMGNGAYKFNDMKINNRIQLNVNKNTRNDDTILMITEYECDIKYVNSLCNRIPKLYNNEKIRGIRCLGSCGINMCYIASNKADVYFGGYTNKLGPKPWDFTAGEVVIKEAGGYIVNIDGNEFDCTKGNILCASSKELCDLFLDNKYACVE